MNSRSLSSALLLLAAATGLVSGCATMSGKQTSPLTTRREIPGVVLCMSERTAGGGIRIVGRVDPGIYPITGATLEYRVAGPSEDAPTAPDQGGGLMLAGARTAKVQYEKGSHEVAYTIEPGGMRNLGDKVLWYRWLLGYERGSQRVDATEVHRTSADEAGLPRAPGSPGPDASVATPATTSRWR